jgi:hypothetical protein
MKQYMIVATDNRRALVALVESFIAQGWSLQGGVAYDSNRKEFLQAMVKP